MGAAKAQHTWRILSGVTNVNNWPAIKAAAQIQIDYAKREYKMELELAGYEEREGTVWGRFYRKPRKFSMKSCSNCAHRWQANGARSMCCGKEGVNQQLAEAARAPDGDCGPEAKFYLEDEEAYA